MELSGEGRKYDVEKRMAILVMMAKGCEIGRGRVFKEIRKHDAQHGDVYASAIAP